MSSQYESALYSPYGAFELKAKYQKNFLMATALTTAVVLLILLTAWVLSRGEEDVVAVGRVKITTIAELGPPPTVAKRPPQVKVDQPKVAAPKVGIPTPVADDELLDEDVVIASKDDLAEIVAPVVSAEGGDDIVVDISDEEYFPDATEFVPVEIYPEMIHQEKAEYPRLARQAGLEGRVVVQALVDREGNVRKAEVFTSSGTASLDDAAVKAAFKNKFKPAIQNGRPVALWVTYNVDFKLTDAGN
jgi:protein TonB